MTVALPAAAELGVPGRTGPVCLYRLVDDRPFDACWEPPEDDGFDTLAVPDLGEALLVFGQQPEKECGWVEMVRRLTDVHLDHFRTARASALLFVRVAGHGFALSFGDGYRRLVRSAVDRGFGLALALRVIDADEVRHIKREHLTGTGRVDTSSVPAGDALWSFGIREHSELVRRIVGRAGDASRLKLSHVRKMAERGVPPVSIDFADRVRLPLPHSPQHLVADLEEIVRVLDEGEVDADLAPLQRVRRLGAGDQERIDTAWDGALELLAGGDDDRVSLAYPAGYHGGQEISRFDVHISRNRIVSTGEMDPSVTSNQSPSSSTTRDPSGRSTDTVSQFRGATPSAILSPASSNPVILPEPSTDSRASRVTWSSMASRRYSASTRNSSAAEPTRRASRLATCSGPTTSSSTSSG